MVALVDRSTGVTVLAREDAVEGLLCAGFSIADGSWEGPGPTAPPVPDEDTEQRAATRRRSARSKEPAGVVDDSTPRGGRSSKR